MAANNRHLMVRGFLCFFLFGFSLTALGQSKLEVLNGTTGMLDSGEKLDFAGQVIDIKSGGKLIGNSDTSMDRIGELIINRGGQLDLVKDKLTLEGGKFENHGNFRAGTSTVVLDLMNSTRGEIKGNSTFHNLTIKSRATDTLKNFVLESNRTQSIKLDFKIESGTANPIKIRSSGSQPAYLDIRSGSAPIVGVIDVDNVHVIGQIIWVSAGSKIGKNSRGFRILSQSGENIFSNEFETN